MEFALFVFCEDNSCAVGECKWIIDQDESTFNDEDWDHDKEVLVRWPKTKDYNKWSSKNGKFPVDVECETKTYVTRVLKFNDRYDAIRGFMSSYLDTGSTLTPIRGRGKRTAKRTSRYMDMSENDEIPISASKKMKTKKHLANSSLSQSHIEHLRRKIAKEKYISSETESSEDEEVEDEENTEITELKKCLAEKDEEIKELKSIIKRTEEMQNLSDVVKELKESAKYLTNFCKKKQDMKIESKTIGCAKLIPVEKEKMRFTYGIQPSSPASSCGSRASSLSSLSSDTASRALSLSSIKSDTEADNYVTICPDVVVTKVQNTILIKKPTAKEFVYTIMPMLWSREVLATHSVTGRRSNAHKDSDAKPQLDNRKVDSICAYASKKYGCPSSVIRQHMTTKINNVIKCCKVQKPIK